MNSIRAASLCFVVASAAPLPVYAQATPPTLATRLSALEGAVAALQNSLNAEEAIRAANDATLQIQINAEAAARVASDTTLLAQIDTLKGNITETDLEGTYNFYFVATGLDPAEDNVRNIISSYVITGTVTLGTDGTGFMNAAASGRALTELMPPLNWLAADVSGGPIVGPVSWRYGSGKVDFEILIDSIAIPSQIRVTPAAGGPLMFGAKGGPPDNDQRIIVLTRQP